MEQNRATCGKIATEIAHETQPPYSTEPPHPARPSLFPKGRRRRALLCGVISTGLSIFGFISLALFQQYNGMLSELRTDLKHFNETSSEYVKKDRLQKCWERLKECSKEMSVLAATRERLEQEVKASERTRENISKEMQKLRERLAYLEGMKVGTAINTSGSSVHRSTNQDQDLYLVRDRKP